MRARTKLHRTFCANVRFWRKERGLTQVEAAAKCRMTHPQYCDIENGRYAPTLDTIERLARAFAIEAEEFFRQREIAAV